MVSTRISISEITINSFQEKFYVSGNSLAAMMLRNKFSVLLTQT